MKPPRVVVDTCVLVSALRSKRGASYRLLGLLDGDSFEMYLSLSLFLQYEDVCNRLPGVIPLTKTDIDDALNFVSRIAHHQKVHYLWRPCLSDPNDDMVLELAVAAGCTYIVTHNTKDFRGVEQFGILAVTPKEFLQKIGELP